MYTIRDHLHSTTCIYMDSLANIKLLDTKIRTREIYSANINMKMREVDINIGLGQVHTCGGDKPLLRY